MKCFYHVNRDAVGQCVQCGRFACYACLVDVGGMLLCPSCEADAQQQMVAEQTRLLNQAKRAVTLSSVLAMVLILFTAMTTMLVMVQPDGNVLLGVFAHTNGTHFAHETG